jgi:hypothetical protein
MVQRIVNLYFAQWDVNNHDGVIKVFEESNSVADEPVGQIRTANPEEFRLIVDLLRNEKPVAFEDGALQLRVGHQVFNREPVGEGEA